MKSSVFCESLILDKLKSFQMFENIRIKWRIATAALASVFAGWQQVDLSYLRLPWNKSLGVYLWLKTDVVELVINQENSVFMQ